MNNENKNRGSDNKLYVGSILGAIIALLWLILFGGGLKAFGLLLVCIFLAGYALDNDFWWIVLGWIATNFGNKDDNSGESK